jgi:hypothetical protein
MSNGRRQPSCGGTSRMTRECQVRFCERLGVQFPGPTRQTRSFEQARGRSGYRPKRDVTAEMLHRPFRVAVAAAIIRCATDIC